MELFIQVCEGVQHAHQKAIIHRDLKPSNILVSEVDGKPMPRIIDFGVAKATAQRLTAETMFTRAGALLGTLGYMSPEQADRPARTSTRAPTCIRWAWCSMSCWPGALPLDFKKLALRRSSMRKLREEEAPRPSTKLRTSGRSSDATGAEPRRGRSHAHPATARRSGRHHAQGAGEGSPRGVMPRPPNWPPTSEDICAMSQ